ncbi:PTS sugar transporter subunit IIA [Shimazuella alba]|uniref:PTS glucose transporter subunit IIA n=1 Tax=Shimazuella alba TaxID=2690964 RepID=A0A6I4VX59_9BACL|nr:PTS glucose transporter subunit IIA [Shimazuella alba]MXQ55241.1 PTS glucose transporter subunit IIA [Shimazuella alba]
MFDKLFGKKQEQELFVSPLSGEMIKMEETPDLVFSKKMMGDGVAIIPFDGKVVAPIDGEIIQIFPTKHAIGILSNKGLEILIHIGLETVAMKGEGFTVYVNKNDKIKAGDLLMEFDLELIKKKASSTVTPIVITNGEKIQSIEKTYSKEAVAGQTQIWKVKY